MSSRIVSGVLRGRIGLVMRLAIVCTLVVSVFSVTRSASAHSAGAKGPFVLGVSNTLVGNGWREEMICAVKAEAKASGVVKKVLVADINGNAAEQINGIRNLISSGANAIIANPADRVALNPVIAQAHQRGIVFVTVDQLVTSPYAYKAENNQVEYGKVGMEWLARTLHGHGNIVVLRGIAGVPADTDRETGIKEALKEYPGIHVLAEEYTGWQFAPAGTIMLNLLNAHHNIDGVWTSGTDYTVVNAYTTAHRPYVPVVGADENEFLHQIIALHSKGFIGAAVTNPATIGGVGASIAIGVLEGKHEPMLTKLTPAVWDYAHSLATIEANYSPLRPATYSARLTIAPYTHYTPAELTGCQGP
jgi:ribose transport system substrate-binding protein